MIPSKDDMAKKALSRWQSSEVDSLMASMDRYISKAPKMTPIEEIVFYTLQQCRLFSGLEFKILPQEKISCYRVDFLLRDFIFHIPKPKIMVNVVIECDGHDYHERTKEQSQRDKERDRNLQNLGYRVYRFTGSEIWKSSGVCVANTLGFTEME